LGAGLACAQRGAGAGGRVLRAVEGSCAMLEKKTRLLPEDFGELAR